MILILFLFDLVYIFLLATCDLLLTLNVLRQYFIVCINYVQNACAFKLHTSLFYFLSKRLYITEIHTISVHQ